MITLRLDPTRQKYAHHQDDPWFLLSRHEEDGYKFIQTELNENHAKNIALMLDKYYAGLEPPGNITHEVVHRNDITIVWTTQ